MLTLSDILQILGVIAVIAVLAVVLRSRRRGKQAHDLQYSLDNVCEHLRPALEKLLERGHRIRQVGQLGPDMPLEIHIEPTFDPGKLYEELSLTEPVFLSERNVLFCKEDWCELHPLK